MEEQKTGNTPKDLKLQWKKQFMGFEIRAPRLWNTLSDEIQQAESVASFKSKLKMHFYCTTFADFL